MTTSIRYAEERLELFPTLVWKRRYEGLEGMNERLRQLVLEKEREESGLVLSNVGGYHSKQDLLLGRDPALTVFVSLVQNFVHAHTAARLDRDPSTFQTQLSMEAWANVSRAGDYARPHVHPSSNFAVVYYVDAGDAPAGERPVSGLLEMLDPRGRPEMFLTPGVNPADTVAFRPETGLLLLFPSWLYHYVHPYRGERPRISIAVNVSVREIRELPKAEAT